MATSLWFRDPAGQLAWPAARRVRATGAEPRGPRRAEPHCWPMIRRLSTDCGNA